MSASGMVKIALSSPSGLVETVWASPVGNNLYRLENLPFMARGVSFHDIVEAVVPSSGGFPTFLKCVSKSGNRTIRLDIRAPASESAHSRFVLDRIKTLGGGFEVHSATQLTLNIPPEMDLDAFAAFLNESGEGWSYHDPTYEELLARSRSELQRPDA